MFKFNRGKYYLILMLIVSILMTGCSYFSSGQPKLDPNVHIAIYLVSESDRNDYIKKDLNSIKIDDMPLITDSDIKSLNWKDQALILNDNMTIESYLQRRGESIPGQGLPFVLVCNGERIYMGAFWSITSSYGIYDFILIGPMPATNTHSYNISFNKVYTDGSSDKRFDKRIYQALKESNKLIE